MHIILIEAKFLGGLAVTEIESHQVQTPDPLTQGLMMASKHCSCQVIKLPLAVQSAVPLSGWLSLVVALFDDVGIGGVWTLDAMRPA